MAADDWLVDVIIAVSLVLGLLVLGLAAICVYCCFYRHRNRDFPQPLPTTIKVNYDDRRSLSSIGPLDKKGQPSTETGMTKRTSAIGAPSWTRRSKIGIPMWRQKARRMGDRYRKAHTVTALGGHRVNADRAIRLRLSDNFRPRSHSNLGFAPANAMPSSMANVPVYSRNVDTARSVTGTGSYSLGNQNAMVGGIQYFGDDHIAGQTTSGDTWRIVGPVLTSRGSDVTNNVSTANIENGTENVLW